MKKWRMGIIGCGWAGEQHANAMHALPDRIQLCALADVDVGRAKSSAEKWDVPDWTASYEDLLHLNDLDAVSICLPHHLHASVAIAAADAGLHVLIEKPLATTLAEADAMIATADAGGVCLMVAENVRYHQNYLRAADLIRSGALGDLFLVRIYREHQMHNYLRQRPWFLHEESAGIMVSGGIVDFDLLRMLAGDVTHVYGMEGAKALVEMVADDSCVALVGMQSGAAAVLVESFSLRTAHPGVSGTVHGSLGSLWFDSRPAGDRISLYRESQDGQQELVEEIVNPASDTFQAEVSHFLDCLDNGAEPITSGREERNPLVAVLATYASMERGERVYLSEFEAEPES